MKEQLLCHASAAAPSSLPEVHHNSNFINWDIAYDVYRVPMAIIPRYYAKISPNRSCSPWAILWYRLQIWKNWEWMQGLVFWSIYINLNQQSNKMIKLRDGTHETEQTMILIADLEQACISWRPRAATVPHFNWKCHLYWSNCSFWYPTFIIGQLLWTWSSLRDDGLVAPVRCSHVEKLAEWSINSLVFLF